MNPPKRTCNIIGIDANGHIGRDPPEPYVGNLGSTTWNGNETAWAELAQTAEMTIYHELPKSDMDVAT